MLAGVVMELAKRAIRTTTFRLIILCLFPAACRESVYWHSQYQSMAKVLALN
jgi:hypothetical protein